mmetsp:Transcript_17267/g.52523  ORF Transcript_17267/g.52523 Transcript_17267/m.52523 type:complete len:342 (-) Transcript_17267:206-1231(-)
MVGPELAEKPTTTERVVLEKYGGPEELKVETVPMPRPGPGEVRIKVLAASVQYTDTLIRRGLYPGAPKPPLVLGYDVVGDVEAIGEGVQSLKIGDRVADLTVTGSYAKHRLLKAEDCTPVSRELDPAQAAAVVLSGTTAYQMLHREAKLQPGERVLIVPAGGAVGRLCVELAVAHNAEVFAVARPHHHDRLRALGATPLEDVSNAEKIDVAIDGLGLDYFGPTFRTLGDGGRLVAFGFTDIADTTFGLTTTLKIGLVFTRLWWWNLWPNRRSTTFYNVANRRMSHPDHFKDDLASLFSKVSRLRSAAVQDRLSSLSDVPEAHRRIAQGQLHGKLVLTPSSS